MTEYWDLRYQAEGKIWGEQSSKTAEYALQIFQAAGVKKLLVAGSGYGRNTKLFSAAGFTVTGVEIAFEACKMAMTYDPDTRVYNNSVLDMSFLPAKFDGLYSFNVLHLFKEVDRRRFIRQADIRVKKQHPLFFTVFSEKEESFGKGAETEKNTFESKPGRPVHYFSEQDLREHFRDFEIMETGLMEDAENHGGGPHTHILRYIYVKNK
jgi:hypothetical protein